MQRDKLGRFLDNTKVDVVAARELATKKAKKAAADQPSWFRNTLGFTPFSYQQKLGFNVKLLGSGSYILKVLEKLSPRELRRLRDVFLRVVISG